MEHQCKTCRWFALPFSGHGFCHFVVKTIDPAPFWVGEQIYSPMLDEEEGTHCTAWEGRDGTD